jgi:hypothetical protein
MSSHDECGTRQRTGFAVGWKAWLLLALLLGFTNASGSTTTLGTGDFHVKNGEIIDPNGNTWRAFGINVDVEALPYAVQTSTGAPLTTHFPKINHVRVYTYSMSQPGIASATYPQPTAAGAALTNWRVIVNACKILTALKIVCEIEDHSSNGGQWEYYGKFYGISAPPTGGALTTILNWYSAIAKYWKGNPYVWFGGLNEMNSTDGSYKPSSIAPISTYQKQIYNTIRDTGNTSMIQFLAGLGPGTVGINGGFVAADYASMTNILWELHEYYTDGTLSGAQAQITGSTAACCGGYGGAGYLAAQTIQSADGVVPVIVAEYGSRDAGLTDATSIIGVFSNAPTNFLSSDAWAWDPGDPSTEYQLISGGYTKSSQAPTTYGKQVAALIATNPIATLAPSANRKD